MNIRISALLAFILSTGFMFPTKALESPDSIRDMTKAENLLSPTVSAKQHEAVSRHMLEEARKLVRLGYNVETERRAEVIVITVPASVLFEPNEATLLTEGKNKLQPLVAYLNKEDRYKMILAMHSDDTGSPVYKDSLTDLRVAAVENYLASIAQFPDQIVSYAMADEEPLKPNDTRDNRALNRRLEIFIVPADALIKSLKKK